MAFGQYCAQAAHHVSSSASSSTRSSTSSARAVVLAGQGSTRQYKAVQGSKRAAHDSLLQRSIAVLQQIALKPMHFELSKARRSSLQQAAAGARECLLKQFLRLKLGATALLCWLLGPLVSKLRITR
jgi:hypothetical protein